MRRRRDAESLGWCVGPGARLGLGERRVGGSTLGALLRHVFLPGFVGLTEKSPSSGRAWPGPISRQAPPFSILIFARRPSPAPRASWFLLAPALVASFDVPSSATAGRGRRSGFGLADSSFSLKPMFAPVLADVRSRGAALTAGSTARALFFAGAGAGAA